MSQHWEEILVLAGEGGRVSLLGSKTLDNTWIFMKETTESALADLLDDEDLSDLLHQRSYGLNDWEQAISLIGRSWFRLRPLFVNSQFKRQVWNVVSSKVEGNDLRYWDRLCNADA